MPENSGLKARVVDDEDTLKATVTVDTISERFCPAHTVNLREVIQDSLTSMHTIQASPGVTALENGVSWLHKMYGIPQELFAVFLFNWKG